MEDFSVAWYNVRANMIAMVVTIFRRGEWYWPRFGQKNLCPKYAELWPDGYLRDVDTGVRVRKAFYTEYTDDLSVQLPIGLRTTYVALPSSGAMLWLDGVNPKTGQLTVGSKRSVKLPHYVITRLPPVTTMQRVEQFIVGQQMEIYLPGEGPVQLEIRQIQIEDEEAYTKTYRVYGVNGSRAYWYFMTGDSARIVRSHQFAALKEDDSAQWI